MGGVATRLSGAVIGCGDAWGLEEPFVPPVWPTVAGQQQMGMHLDIAVDGLAPMSDIEQRHTQFFEVVDRATSLGARVADHQPQPDRVVVMVDPAGHPFCLFPGQ